MEPFEHKTTIALKNPSGSLAPFSGHASLLVCTRFRGLSPDPRGAQTAHLAAMSVMALSLQRRPSICLWLPCSFVVVLWPSSHLDFAARPVRGLSLLLCPQILGPGVLLDFSNKATSWWWCALLQRA